MTYILRRRKLGKGSCSAIAAFSTQGIRVVRNFRDPIPDDPNEICIRWGCTSNVPQNNVFNRAEAIHRVNDKTSFRVLLDQHALCPATWTDSIDNIPKDLGIQFVVRPRTHHQGRHLYHCTNYHELIAAISRCGDGWYAAEYIPKVAEYRVFVVQGRAVAVAKKTPANPEAIAWNVAQGGRFDNVRWDEWPLKAVKTSIKAFMLSGLDFGGVDVMVDAGGDCFVLEINAAPSLTSPYRQECITKALDWMIQHGKRTIPLIEERGGYKKFIHPAICSEAILI